MGNLCQRNSANIESKKKISKTGYLTLVCSKNEFSFWNQLHKLELVYVSHISKSDLKVEFDYSQLNFEEIITLSQIVSIFDKDQNFLLFHFILEVLLAIIDWLQIVIELKKKYEIPKFFLIYFDKFILEKSKEENKLNLRYTCDKLNEHYSNSDIMIQEDGLICSFSIADNSNSFHKIISNIKREFKTPGIQNERSFTPSNEDNEYSDKEEDNENEKDQSDVLDSELNKYFYSKSKLGYAKLRKDYDLSKVDPFYADIIINFINRFLLKKTIVNHENLYSDFMNLKGIIRNSFKEIKKEEFITLQKLKEFLSTILYNTYEMNLYKSKLSTLINKFENLDESTYNKILIYKRLNLNLSYGTCDVMNNQDHKHCFIYDYSIMNTSKSAYNFCLECSWNIILKKIPENYNEKINLAKLELEIRDKFKKKSSSGVFDLFSLLKYFLYIPTSVTNVYYGRISNFNVSNTNFNLSISDRKTNNNDFELSNRKTTGNMTVDSMKVVNNLLETYKKDIFVYKKQDHVIIFEFIKFDTDGQVVNSEILNFDSKVKNIVSSKVKLSESSLLITSSFNN